MKKRKSESPYETAFHKGYKKCSPYDSFSCHEGSPATFRRSLAVLGMTLLFCLLAKPAFAALDLELTKGVAGAIPVAVVPFNQPVTIQTNISDVISKDLTASGQFNAMNKADMQQHPFQSAQIDTNYWQKQNINDMVIGQVSDAGYGRYKVKFELVDPFNKTHLNNGVILSGEYTVNEEDMRRVAHKISDEIYEQLTGEKGAFSTRLAYVLVQNLPRQPRKYSLQIADYDGYNAKPILVSSQPIMSPSWSHDGRRVAYVSFERYIPEIYISDVGTGKRQLVSNYAGINGAPAWSPDDRKMAMALSRGGANPNIYLLDLASNHLQQITNDGSINTEPRFAPDGRSLLFTSDRGGSPQVYQLNLADNQTQRVTYQGNYNATSNYTPDGHSVVLLHRAGSGFNVAVLNLGSGNFTELTHEGVNQSPSVAPNGRMIVYATEYSGKGILGMVSIDGKVHLRLPDQNGSVQEPAWSPLLV